MPETLRALSPITQLCSVYLHPAWHGEAGYTQLRSAQGSWKGRAVDSHLPCG